MGSKTKFHNAIRSALEEAEKEGVSSEHIYGALETYCGVYRVFLVRKYCPNVNVAKGGDLDAK